MPYVAVLPYVCKMQEKRVTVAVHCNRRGSTRLQEIFFCKCILSCVDVKPKISKRLLCRKPFGLSLAPLACQLNHCDAFLHLKRLEAKRAIWPLCVCFSSVCCHTAFYDAKIPPFMDHFSPPPHLLPHPVMLLLATSQNPSPAQSCSPSTCYLIIGQQNVCLGRAVANPSSLRPPPSSPCAV